MSSTTTTYYHPHIAPIPASVVDEVRAHAQELSNNYGYDERFALEVAAQDALALWGNIEPNALLQAVGI